MAIETYADAGPFWERAAPFLAAREAEHHLLLGVGGRLAAGQMALDPAAAFKAIVTDDSGAVIGVALMTPPFNVVLSDLPDDAIPDLAARAFAFAPDARGVLGPPALSRRFAAEWSRLSRGYARQGKRERIYQLTAVSPPAGVPGRRRPATLSDRDLLAHWIVAFDAEALHEITDLAAALDEAELLITTQTRVLSLWEVAGVPVTMVGYTGATPHGLRVGPVYTPPEQRGRGYASAATAAVSQIILDSGKRYCFLYTDLANRTANHIYQTIGYVPVADALEYRFN